MTDSVEKTSPLPKNDEGNGAIVETVEDKAESESIPTATNDAVLVEEVNETSEDTVGVGDVEVTETVKVDKALPAEENEATPEPRAATSSGPSGKPDSFAKLVRTWEAYINDDQGEVFQPLQMLQSLQLCGRAGEGLARLAGPSLPGTDALQPPALRHIQSTPLQYRPAMFDYNDEETVPPPPVPLNPFQRSSSTPSTFRSNSVNSAFGTVDSGAFRIPSNRSIYSSVGAPGAHFSAFDPVKYYATALEDMERTSIEVTDMSMEPKESTGEDKGQPKSSRRGAASRAARFLSDVRTLRRRRRMRGGRENPAQPSSVSSDSNEEEKAEGNKAAVTVITETDYTPMNIPKQLPTLKQPESTEQPEEKDESMYSPVVDSDPEDKGEDSPVSQQYHQLDSDVDEEEMHYQRIEASLQAESPGTVPSPSYQPIGGERPSGSVLRQEGVNGSKISIQVSNAAKSPPVRMMEPAVPAATPSPTRSNDSGTGSPGTTRSSNTGSTSGHTTQAASLSSGHQSNLSTISETDREVMEANKQGKRRLYSKIGPVAQKTDGDGTSLNSSSTGSSNPAGYLALEESPVALREGANVPADRFFTNSPGTAEGVLAQAGIPLRSRTSSTKKAGNSPVTLESSSETNTSSSNSFGEEPPTFVSYLHRQAASDLSSVREAAETSSTREDGGGSEEREGSPAEIVGYPQVLFEEASTPKEQQPMSVRGAKQNLLDKYRARPPRSPVKGARPVTTPPPRGSVSPLYLQHSPPRILDHPESNLSRPFVTRTVGAGSSTTPLILSSVIETQDQLLVKTANVGVGSAKQVEAQVGPFEEGSIEVLKTDPVDELNSANLVTPEKELNA